MTNNRFTLKITNLLILSNDEIVLILETFQGENLTFNPVGSLVASVTQYLIYQHCSLMETSQSGCAEIKNVFWSVFMP